MLGLYPDLPGPRAHALLRDALTITLLACFVWLGLRVHHDVDRLSGLGRAARRLLLLVNVLPDRIQEIRHIRGLRRALRGPDAEARQRLLALRATMILPDRVLFSYTPDPAGDLLAGRYEALAAAALEANGIRPASIE